MKKINANAVPIKKSLKRDWELYLFLLLPVAYVFIFNYIPMGGLVIAFKDYEVRKGIWESDWVGLEQFKRFFESYMFKDVMGNTIVLALYGLIAGFPIPVLFALTLNSVKNKRFKKITQTIVNMPHFISTVVMVGVLMLVFHNRLGIYGNLVHVLTGEYPGDVFASPSAFRHFYVWSGVWQGFGWSSIIYTAALTGVDPSYHEAAQLDGASRFQRVIYVDLPTIVPTIVTLLILDMGSILSLGYEKVLLMQNSLNISASQVVSTYVYEMGISGGGAGNFSYSTAIGMFNNVIELILLIIVNQISKRISDTSVF
ncbi:MAG: sugar ABC transporter permease [Lachnospiraceae bacterium]|nr:sugar ABC transporter permease [Lachnospiraceae bacterium]